MNSEQATKYKQDSEKQIYLLKTMERFTIIKSEAFLERRNFIFDRYRSTLRNNYYNKR